MSRITDLMLNGYDPYEGIMLCGHCFGDGLARNPSGEYIIDDVCPSCYGDTTAFPDWIKNLCEEIEND